MGSRSLSVSGVFRHGFHLIDSVWSLSDHVIGFVCEVDLPLAILRRKFAVSVADFGEFRDRVGVLVLCRPYSVAKDFLMSVLAV